MRFSLSAFFTDLSFGLAFMCNTVECEDRGRDDILNVVIVVIDIALLDLVPEENGSEGLRHPVAGLHQPAIAVRSEEHTSELQSLMRTSYAVFCLKKKKN